MISDKELVTMLRARVTHNQKRQLEAIALANQISMSAVVRQAIREYLAANFGRRGAEPQPESVDA